MSYDILKNFYSSLKSKKSSKISIFYVFSRFQSPMFTFEGSIKTKKSPSAYVCANKNCFRCHAIMLFVSASTYDHEQVFTNLLYHCHSSRKVFMESKVIRCHSQNSNFLNYFEQIYSKSLLEPKWLKMMQKVTICEWLLMTLGVVKKFLEQWQCHNKFVNTSLWSQVLAEINSMTVWHPKQFLFGKT